MPDYRLDVEVSQDNALRSLDLLARRLAELDAQGNRTSTTLTRTGSAGTAASKGFNLLNQTSSNAGVGMMRLDKSSNNLNGSLGILTKSLLSYELAARAISASDAYIGMQNRLKLVTDSERELQIGMQDTFDISQKTGAVWASTVQIYQRFLDVSDKVGKSQAEIGRITETVSKSVAMSGATAESANAAMVQFSQGIASGVLRGEEFNSVAEQTPALLDAIARGLGKDRSELRAMAQTGKLTTELLVGALEKSADSTDLMFGRMTLGISATYNKLRNETTKFVGEMSESSGAASALVSVMNLLAENLDGALFIAGTAALATMTKTVFASTAATMTNIATKNTSRLAIIAEMEAIAASTAAVAAESRAKVAALTASVAEAQQRVKTATSASAEAIAKGVLTSREAQLTVATVANTAATAAETAATNTLTVATSRLAVAKTAALGVFGGGAGLIAIGLSAAAMYFLLKQGVDESADASAKHAKFIDLEREALEKMNQVQKDNAIDVLTESLKVQNEQIKIAANQYSALVNDILSQSVRNPAMAAHLDEIRQLLTQVRTGAIDFETATDRMNKLNLLTPEQRAQLLDAEKNYKDVYTRAAEATGGLKDFGKAGVIVGSSANNAKLANDAMNASIKDTKTDAEAATAAMQKYAKTLEDSVKYNAYVVARSKTTNLDQAKGEAKYYVDTGKAPDAAVQRAIKIQLDYAAKAKALDDAVKKDKKDANKAEKDALKQERDALKQAERDQESRFKDYMDFVTDARSESEKLGDEWTKFMILWSEFGKGDDATQERVSAAYSEKLAQATIDFNDYRNGYASYWNTELNDLNDYYKREEYLLRHSTRVNKEEKASMRKDLMDAWTNEIDLITIKWEIEKVESRKAFLTEKDYIDQITKLRADQITYDPKLTDDQKDIRKNTLYRDANAQTGAIDQKAFEDYANVVNSADTNPQEQLIKSLDDKRRIVQEAHRQGVIDKEIMNEELSRLDQDYMNSSAQMWANSFGDSLNGWSSFFKNVEGENSSAYRTIFALQKSFSIAAAALNIQKAISDGWATGATIYDKMASVATIIAQTGTIVSDLSSITMGFKDGGYTGNIGRNNIAGFVHGNEFVMPAEKTTKYRNDLEAMRNGNYEKGSSGGGNIFNFNNYFTMGDGGQVSATTEKQDAEIMGNALNAAMKAFLVDQMRQGGLIDNWARRKGL